MSQTLGQYALVRRIGAGGMAEVWMGRRHGVGGAQKTVAIKRMLPEIAAEARHRRMFLEEARLSMLMSHSNVVQVFDAAEQQGQPYLVMEWVDGLDLAQLCAQLRARGQAWPAPLAGYIVGEILRGLGYAHHLIHEGQPRCVVHRDVSPHNVLVSTSGEVKVTDFGVARLATDETSGAHIKGKLRYMAPEHLAGRSRDPAVDLFSVGAILHELLEGVRFRDEEDQDALYGQIMGKELPALTRTDVPPELASLRQGLLQPEPRQRIPSASRALEYLSAWAGYRNASTELATLCRREMGVLGPRSGIEASAVAGGSSPPVGSTTTRATVTGATRTSNASPMAVALEPAEPASPPATSSRRTVLLGAGVIGLGFAVGGLLVRGLRDERTPGDGVEPEDRSQPSAGQGPGAAGQREGTASASEDLGDPRGGVEHSAMEPTGGEAGVEPRGSDRLGVSDGTGPADGGSTRGDPTDEASTGGAASDGPNPDTGSTTGARDPGPAEVSEPKGNAKRRRAGRSIAVEFGLRSPLRVAYVRVGKGPEFVVAPMTTRRVPVGRATVYWKRRREDVWVKGRSFDFRAGATSSIRLTSNGPVSE
ncbi:MAG: protein kinase [Deltaproteobacteria bacterium]|nr:protein kinase [Deltaproteobacteria bacterium]